MSRHLQTQFVESALNLAVTTSEIEQDVDQPPGDVHADLVVECSPPDLEHADQVLTDEKIVGQHPSVAPRCRPVLEAKVADGGGRVRRLAWREGPRLDGASRKDRVCEKRELLGPHRIDALAGVARELQVRL